MNHYVYEITNLLNGKKYIGKRSCKCDIEKDWYMGSGTYLKKAMKKHGRENFKKEILLICETDTEAYKEEQRIIEEINAYKDTMYYNITNGGKGCGCGEGNINYGKKFSKQHIERMNKSIKRLSGENHPMYGKKHSKETLLKMSQNNCMRREEIRRKVTGENHPMLGRKHSEESKIKMSESTKGEKHPNYGKNIKESTKNKISETLKGQKHTEERILNIIKGLGDKSKKVMLVNTNEVFISASIASKRVGLTNGTKIGMCCRGERKSAGKINGEKAVWIYYDEYLKNNNMEGL